MKYAFLRDHRTEFRVIRMCGVLHVSRSGFYAWLAQPVSARAETNRALTDQIVRWHHQTRRVYGAVKHDNAVAESFFSTLKNELVHDRTFLTRDEARSQVFEFIEVFYNRQRAHQTLGYVSPAAFEARRDVP